MDKQAEARREGIRERAESGWRPVLSADVIWLIEEIERRNEMIGRLRGQKDRE
tara:strand:+ start:1029 stop:1187 length:159 start_codon:yes stop_codon:yes gene_type:complete